MIVRASLKIGTGCEGTKRTAEVLSGSAKTGLVSEHVERKGIFNL